MSICLSVCLSDTHAIIYEGSNNVMVESRKRDSKLNELHRGDCCYKSTYKLNGPHVGTEMIMPCLVSYKVRES